MWIAGPHWFIGSVPGNLHHNLQLCVVWSVTQGQDEPKHTTRSASFTWPFQGFIFSTAMDRRFKTSSIHAKLCRFPSMVKLGTWSHRICGWVRIYTLLLVYRAHVFFSALIQCCQIEAKQLPNPCLKILDHGGRRTWQLLRAYGRSFCLCSEGCGSNTAARRSEGAYQDLLMIRVGPSSCFKRAWTCNNMTWCTFGMKLYYS